MEKQTPLFSTHLTLGGKMAAFAGYELPMQYSGIIAEHNAVRTAAGIFDVSHMGELCVEGPDALCTLQEIFTNDMSKMRDGQIKYSPMCNESGGTLDDILIYRKSQSSYLLVVNAGSREKDADWIAGHLKGNTRMTDLSNDYAQIALQGPMSEKILGKLLCNPGSGCLPKYYYFTDNINIAGVPCLVSRTGYTGENGFEFYLAPDNATRLFDALMEEGSKDGLVPCGLGARNTLRLEAGMPLYGHELSEAITPLEAGLSMFVKLSKESFIGRDALLAPPKRKRVGLRVTGRGIAREEAIVLQNGREIGFVSSGTHSPTLKAAIAMAIVDMSFDESLPAEIIIREHPVIAEAVPLPFYKR